MRENTDQNNCEYGHFSRSDSIHKENSDNFLKTDSHTNLNEIKTERARSADFPGLDIID